MKETIFKQTGVANILVLVAALGILAFISISSSASFKNQLFSKLFPKQASLAFTTSDYCMESEEQAFLTLINDYRSQYGLTPLVASQTLGAAARFHSMDMAQGDYLSHFLSGPNQIFESASGILTGDDITWSQNITDFGYISPYRGENILRSYETASAAFLWWQNSAGHNANMLNANYRAIGIGRAYNPNSIYKWFWTTVFGDVVDTQANICTAENPPPPPPLPVPSPTPEPITCISCANPPPGCTWEGTSCASCGILVCPIPAPTPIPTNSPGSTPPTLDAQSSSTVPDSTSLSWNHTTGGCANRILLVGIASRRGSSGMNSVTYNGLNLTNIRFDSKGIDARSELWYLINPPTGTFPLQLNSSVSNSITAGASSFCNVSQSSPITSHTGGFNSAAATNASLQINSVYNDLVVDVIGTQSGAVALSPAAGQTLLFSKLGTWNSAAGSSKAGANSVNLTWTLSYPEFWAMSAASLKPASTNAATPTTTPSATLPPTPSPAPPSTPKPTPSPTPTPTQIPADTQSPSAPANLIATAISSSQINLSWNPSSDNVGIAGYDIYRNGGKVATVASTSYGDANLISSTPYSYFVKAIDTAGNVSPSSNTASATTQPPPSATTGSITGAVSSSEGGTVSGVSVSTTIGSSTKTVTTNSQGSYIISQLPAGTYSLSFKRRNYRTQTVTVTVGANQTVVKNITLVRR